jgi:hypothetical protein
MNGREPQPVSDGMRALVGAPDESPKSKGYGGLMLRLS